METKRADFKSWAAFGVVTGVGLGLDLWSKVWAFQVSNLQYDGKPHLYEKSSVAGDLVSEIVVIPGWFDFRLAMNEGAAFSMFAGQVNFFMIITVAATLFLCYLVHSSETRSLTLPCFLGLIFSGVLGNFWDRVVFGGVRDFIHWHTPQGGFLFLPEYHYPTFNVADIWICIGAVALVLYYWKEDRAAGLRQNQAQSSGIKEGAAVDQGVQKAANESAKDAKDSPDRPEAKSDDQVLKSVSAVAQASPTAVKGSAKKAKKTKKKKRRR